MSKYFGIVYPWFLDSGVVRWLWVRIFCRVGYHLFDEVVSDSHYLVCDSCDLVVFIEKIDTQWMTAKPSQIDATVTNKVTTTTTP